MGIEGEMDILAQALNVAEEADAATGPVTLTFDLADPSHRAAYAAALAVLRISGIDEDALMAGGVALPDRRSPRVSGGFARSGGESGAGIDAGENGEQGADAPARPGEQEPEREDPNPGRTAELRHRYLAAMEELNPDQERRETVARETFPRVVELLRDGANVESVAQIQYRRWVEEHLDAVR